MKIYIFFTSLFILTFSASLFEVYEVSEAREGAVVQAIIRSDNWILPLRQGEIIPSKPILFHWIGAGFAKFFGFYNEILLRFPSIIAASLILVFSYVFSRRFLTKELAFVSVLILFTSHGFFQLAIDGRVDMLFTLFITTALFIWVDVAWKNFNQRLPCSSIPEIKYAYVAFFCGLAVLTKGPLGIALPGAIIFLMAFSVWGVVGALSVFRISWVISLIMPLFWYYPAWMEGGEAFIEKHLYLENLSRLCGHQAITKKAWWFYLYHFWTQSFPWSLFLLSPTVFKRLKSLLRNDNPVYLFLFIWVVSTIFIFSVSSGKRGTYLIPILPALSVLITASTSQVIKSKKINKQLMLSFGAMLLFLVVITFANILKKYSLGSRVDLVVHALLQTNNTEIYLIIILLCLLGVFTIYVCQKNNTQKDIFYFFCMLALVNLQIISIIVPFFVSVKARTHSMSELVKKANDNIPSLEPLIAVKTHRDESLDVFFYYYHGKVEIINPESMYRIDKGYYLSSQNNLERIKKTVNLMGHQLKYLAQAKRPNDSTEAEFTILKVE